MNSTFTNFSKQNLVITFLFIVAAANSFAQTYLPDPFFGTNGTSQFNFAKGTDRINAAGLTSTGKIITGGVALNATSDFLVCGLLPTGQPDNSFGTNGQVSIDFGGGSDNLISLLVESNGRILTAGTSKLVNVTSCVMARFLADGTLDPFFGLDGLVKFQPLTGIYTSILQKTIVQPDGKILAIGYFLQNSTYRGFVRRYLASGIIDNSFGTSGQTIINFATNSSSYAIDATLNSDGSIMVHGQNYVSKFILGMAKLTATGALDTGFSGDGVMTFSFASNQNYSARIFGVSGGKYVVAGYANNTGGNYKAYVSRFNSDGNIDITYGVMGKCTLELAANNYNSVYDASLLSDESLLLSGESYINNTYQASVYKVSADGLASTSFGTNGSTFINTAPDESAGNAVLVSGNTYFILGGNFSYDENSSKGFCSGLLSNGATASTFGTNGRTQFRFSKAQTLARNLDLLPNGKYMVSGQVENYDSDFFTSRFSASGTLDATFGNSGEAQGLFSGADRYTERVVLANGDMVQLARSGTVTLNFGTLGDFTGAPTYSLVRVNPNAGYIDTSYATYNVLNTEFMTPVAVRKDPQGRLVVLANSTKANTGSGYILRHTSTKKQDLSFGTNGKRNLYLNFNVNDRQALDLLVDSIGNFLVLTFESSIISSQYGFMIEKTTEQGAFVSDFGLGGRLTVLSDYATRFSPAKLFGHKNGYMITGKKGDTAAVARLSLTGQVLGYSKFTEMKTLVKVIDGANGSIIAVGTGAANELVLMKMLPNGEVDPSFNGVGSIKVSHLGFTSVVQDIVVDPNGGFTILHRMKTGIESEKLALTKIVLATENKQPGKNEKKFNVVYPNPAEERIFWKDENQEISRLRVFSQDGKLMQIESAGIGAEGLDIRQLPSGKYFLQLEKSKKTETIHFIKQ